MQAFGPNSQGNPNFPRDRAARLEQLGELIAKNPRSEEMGTVLESWGRTDEPSDPRVLTPAEANTVLREALKLLRRSNSMELPNFIEAISSAKADDQHPRRGELRVPLIYHGTQDLPEKRYILEKFLESNTPEVVLAALSLLRTALPDPQGRSRAVEKHGIEFDIYSTTLFATLNKAWTNGWPKVADSIIQIFYGVGGHTPEKLSLGFLNYMDNVLDNLPGGNLDQDAATSAIAWEMGYTAASETLDDLLRNSGKGETLQKHFVRQLIGITTAGKLSSPGITLAKVLGVDAVAAASLDIAMEARSEKAHDDALRFLLTIGPMHAPSIVKWCEVLPKKRLPLALEAFTQYASVFVHDPEPTLPVEHVHDALEYFVRGSFDNDLSNLLQKASLWVFTATDKEAILSLKEKANALRSLIADRRPPG